MHPLTACQSLADLSSAMLQAARDAQWDQVGELERRYSFQAQVLGQIDTPSSPQERQQMAGVLAAVLATECEVRGMIAQRMAQLSALASSAGAERKLAHAYGGA